MRWSSLFVPTGFLVSCRTFCIPFYIRFRLQGFHLLRPSFPKRSSINYKIIVYWLLQFRSSLLSESFLLSFPLPTKIFQFGRYCLLSHSMSSPYWVCPFGFLRIVTYLQFPVAFRRSSRPSSPSSA